MDDPLQEWERAGETPEELDRHAIEHRWNVFSEISEWRMPASGVKTASTPPPGNAGPWLGWISQQYDPAGNLVEQRSMETGTPLLSSAVGRGFGRISKRSLPTATDNITSWLGYADGTVTGAVDGMSGASTQPPFNGMLGSFEVLSGTTLVVGTEASRDTTLRLNIGDAAALGSRRSVWGYDDLGRLKSDTILALKGDTATLPTNTNDYKAADFRQDRGMTPRLGADQIATLESNGIHDLVPASWTAESGLAHAVEERTVNAAARDYLVAGARRTGDGVWTMEYDVFGRMIAQQREGDDARRIEYQYGPNDRIVGRTAKQKDGSGAWVLEMRSDVLDRDAVPADTTWVWDPMTDRLAGIYRAGADSFGGYDPNAGLVRQYLHGDQGYDDPIEVRALSAAGQIVRYHPVADQLAGGSITAVLDDGGKLVERMLYADSYGDAPHYLQGAVVDMITFNAEKDGAGNVRAVTFEAHLSEQIDASTVAAGVKLEAVKGDGSTSVASAAVTPELFEEHTIRWTLTGEQWQQLVGADGAAAIRVSVASSLRAIGWGDVPVMSPPEWARVLYGVRSSTDAPVMWVEQLGEIDEFPGDDSGERKRRQEAV